MLASLIAFFLPRLVVDGGTESIPNTNRAEENCWLDSVVSTTTTQPPHLSLRTLNSRSEETTDRRVRSPPLEPLLPTHSKHRHGQAQERSRGHPQQVRSLAGSCSVCAAVRLLRSLLDLDLGDPALSEKWNPFPGRTAYTLYTLHGPVHLYPNSRICVRSLANQSPLNSLTYFPSRSSFLCHAGRTRRRSPSWNRRSPTTKGTF